MALELSDAQATRFRARFIASGVRSGLSANAIIGNLQAVGLGQRRSTLLAQISQYQQSPGRLPRLTQSEFTQYLSPSFTLDLPARGPTRYLYPFTVSAVNLTTGETIDVTYSVVSPFRLTPEIANAAAETKVDFGASNLQADYSTLELLGETRFSSDLP